jgi:GTP cyclohydrolase II
VDICGGGGEAALVQAAEAIGPSDLTLLREHSGREPTLVLSAQRARALGCSDQSTGAVVLRPRGEFDATVLSTLVDPLATVGPPAELLSAFEIAQTHRYHGAALKLAKLVGLLPAALVARLGTAPDDLPGWAVERGMPLIAAEKILVYEQCASTTLRPVSRAQIPLAVADAQLVAFRPSTGTADHLAIIVGQPQRNQPVLARLHSECFTCDLLGSLRCDCGDQLRGALAAMAAAGGGVLLYLAQEGAWHRPRQQAARLRPAGPGARYHRCQQRAGLRSGRAVLLARCGDAAPARVHEDTADDQQPGQACGPDALRHRNRGTCAARLSEQRSQ